MIYFTSDLHFYHGNVIRYCNRPFDGYMSMNSALIANWNNTVKYNDDVYILGDITMRGPEIVNSLMPALNGRKHLICGNHDLFVRKESFNATNFEIVTDYHVLNHQIRGKNYMFCLMHYPLLTWNHAGRGSIHLHGHIHSTPEYNNENIRNGILRFDVGVDAHNYSPVSIETVIHMADRARENITIQKDYHYSKK